MGGELHGADSDGATMREAKRILVVDDDPAIRSLCYRILIDEGYQVEEAPDGVAALEMLTGAKSFAGCITDLSMPRMGGCELVIAATKADIVTPFVVISGAVDVAHSVVLRSNQEVHTQTVHQGGAA